VERGQNQLVEETVRFKTQEEVEKRLSNLTRVQREKETNYENTIRSLKEKLTDLEEEFKAYRVRAQSTSTAQSVVEADDDDDVTRKLQQKVNELRKQVANLTNANAELDRMKADVSQKSLLLDQSKKQLEELQSFNAKLQEELKTREEVSKQKKEKLKETLNQLEAKHVKSLVEAEERHKYASEIFTQQITKLKEQYGTLERQKEEEVANLKDTIELMKQANRMARQREAKEAEKINNNSQNESPPIPIANNNNTNVNNSGKNNNTAVLEPVNVPQLTSGSADEKQFFHFAQLQAQRDEEITKLKQIIAELQANLRESEKIIHLHEMQQKVLKEEIRSSIKERNQTSQISQLNEVGINLTYLKNVIIKFMETDEIESLLPVIAKILMFTPEEIKSIKDKRAQRSGGGIWKMFSK
jgi:hypothetical protein